MDTMQEGTAAGLLLYLDQAVRDKNLDVTTGRAYRSAVRRVLGVGGVLLSQIDIRDLKFDEQWSRFRASNEAKDLEPVTLISYRTRVQRAVAMYRAWLAGEREPPKKRLPRKSGQPSGRAPGGPERSPAASAAGYDSTEAAIEYLFPLRKGFRARLHLPEDLTQEEADRVGAFVATLVVGSPSGSRRPT